MSTRRRFHTIFRSVSETSCDVVSRGPISATQILNEPIALLPTSGPLIRKIPEHARGKMEKVNSQNKTPTLGIMTGC